MFITRRSVRWAVGFLGVLAGLLGNPSGLGAQMAQSISVIVFPGGFNWPIWVAQEKGYFTQNRIEVRLTNTPNLVFQLTGLIEGRFDIAMTAIDNVVAYIKTLPDQPAAPTVKNHGSGGATLYSNCSACHGAAGQGVQATNAPRLKGMSDWYMVTQLKNFRQGVRGAHMKDPYGPQMVSMAAMLTGVAVTPRATRIPSGSAVTSRAPWIGVYRHTSIASRTPRNRAATRAANTSPNPTLAKTCWRRPTPGSPRRRPSTRTARAAGSIPTSRAAATTGACT